MKTVKITYFCDYCMKPIEEDDEVMALMSGRIGYGDNFIADDNDIMHYHDYCVQNLLTLRYKPEDIVLAPEDDDPDDELDDDKPDSGFDYAHLKELMAEKMTVRKMAEEMGVSPSTIYNHMKKLREAEG